MSDLIVPSMEEGPPFTRARMFCTLLGPVKVADWSLTKLNSLKLWKRLPPRCVPPLIEKSKPLRDTLEPRPLGLMPASARIPTKHKKSEAMIGRNKLTLDSRLSL